MAQYTQSIREILQQNKTANEDLTNITDLYNVSKRSLFDTGVVDSYITSTHQFPFIAGFTLHFFNDELALETLPLWKIALNEKIFNNAEYIDLIFENLDKQVFADYKVKAAENHGNKIATASGSFDNTDSKSQSVAKTGSDTINKTEEGTLEKGGTVDHAKSGSDTLAKTGTIGDSGSYTEQATHTGTDAVAKTGKDTVKHTGDIVTDHDGADTVTNNLLTTNENLGGTVTDKANSIDINYDTPQGSLANMRSPGGDATGTGVAYANGQTYNYMSSAGEDNRTNVHEDLSRNQSEDTGTVETAYDSATTQTFGNDDETNYASTTTETRNLNDGKTGSTGNTRTMGTNDTQSYDSSQLDTFDTTDTDSRESTETRATEDNENLIGSGEQHGVNSNTNSESTTANDNTTEYTMNWEMLYRSMPLLNKVWEIFDDLFMILL